MQVELSFPRCTHPNNQLLICDSGQCFSEPSKVFVCTECCIEKHNHGLMNFTRPSQFQKYCYKLDELTYLKDQVLNEIKTKFNNLRTEILNNLQIKEQFLYSKLEQILSKNVIAVVYDCFIKGKIQPHEENEYFEIVKEVRDVEETRQVLEQCLKVVGDFSLNEAFLFTNNIFDLSNREDSGEKKQNQKSINRVPYCEENQNQRKEDQVNILMEEIQSENENENGNGNIMPVQQIPILHDTIKTQNKDNTASIKTKYIKQKERMQNGKVYINLDDLNVPLEIRVSSFLEANEILKENLQTVDLGIIIQNSEAFIDGKEKEKQNQRFNSHHKTNFFKDLSNLKNLQSLNLEIEMKDPLELDNLIDLEMALCCLKNLKQFSATYYVSDPETFLYDYPQTKAMIGRSNVIIRPKNYDSNYL